MLVESVRKFHSKRHEVYRRQKMISWRAHSEEGERRAGFTHRRGCGRRRHCGMLDCRLHNNFQWGLCTINKQRDTATQILQYCIVGGCLFLSFFYFAIIGAGVFTTIQHSSRRAVRYVSWPLHVAIFPDEPTIKLTVSFSSFPYDTAYASLQPYVAQDGWHRSE